MCMCLCVGRLLLLLQSWIIQLLYTIPYEFMDLYPIGVFLEAIKRIFLIEVTQQIALNMLDYIE